MSYFSNRQFLLEVQKGNVPGHSFVGKFGAASSVGTSFVPVCESLVYSTPTSATALEAISDDIDDGPGGTADGARELTIIGLNSSWQEVSQTVTLNGTTAVALSTNLIRLYRFYVSSSGTYANQSTPSHKGNLTIRESGGGTTWATIPISSFPLGQSVIGAYTIPTGYTGYLLDWGVDSDSTKTMSAIFFQRPNADDVSSLYSGAMRAVSIKTGVVDQFRDVYAAPRGPFVGPCDLGVLAKMSSTTSAISTDFGILLVAVADGS